jgi:hypothetical protein
VREESDAQGKSTRRLAPVQTALAGATMLGLMRASLRAAGPQNQIRSARSRACRGWRSRFDPIMRGNV